MSFVCPLISLFPCKQVCLHCVTFVYSVTEVVWETDGVEEPHETKPASAKTVAQPAVVETKPITDKLAPSKAQRGPQQGASTKGSNKSAGKAAAKGPQQGKLDSFFKRKS
jgi:hypothetical protein